MVGGTDFSKLAKVLPTILGIECEAKAEGNSNITITGEKLTKKQATVTVKTGAKVLEEAKEKAIESLTDGIDDYDIYKNVQGVIDAVKAAEGNINAAGTVEAVKTAKTEGKGAIKAVIAEKTADEIYEIVGTFTGGESEGKNTIVFNRESGELNALMAVNESKFDGGSVKIGNKTYTIAYNETATKITVKDHVITLAKDTDFIKLAEAIPAIFGGGCTAKAEGNSNITITGAELTNKQATVTVKTGEVVSSEIDKAKKNKINEIEKEYPADNYTLVGNKEAYEKAKKAVIEEINKCDTEKDVNAVNIAESFKDVDDDDAIKVAAEKANEAVKEAETEVKTAETNLATANNNAAAAKTAADNAVADAELISQKTDMTEEKEPEVINEEDLTNKDLSDEVKAYNEAVTAYNNAVEDKETAKQAVEAAATTLTTAANDALTTAENAKTVAEQKVAEAQTAKNEADEALEEAKEAKEKADAEAKKPESSGGGGGTITPTPDPEEPEEPETPVDPEEPEVTIPEDEKYAVEGDNLYTTVDGKVQAVEGKKFVRIGTDWYMTRPNGTVAKDCMRKWTDGEWYLFRPDGTMVADKMRRYKNHWFLMRPDGTMVANKMRRYKNHWFMFDANGYMLANTTRTYKGVTYTIDANGYCHW